MRTPSSPGPRTWLLLLLMIVCLPRVALDICLPALPDIAIALHASDAQLHLTLTLYMLGYALSMLISGPLCDRFGRRPLLLLGGTIYLLASLACSLASSVEVMIAARLFQALGGCCGAVIGRVMVRDHFDRQQQGQLLGYLSMGMALSPMIAPVLGSLIETGLGWRWIFLLLTLSAALSLLLIALRLPETRPPQVDGLRQQPVLKVYLRLLGDGYFMRYSLAIACVYCTYFPFIAESSTLLQRRLGLSSAQYAAVFAVTVGGYLVGSQLFRRRSGRYSADALLGQALVLNLAGALLLMLATRLWPDALLAIVLPMLLIMLSVGLAIPACQWAVLQPYAAIAGSASGLFFFIQMAFTALCSLVIGQLSDGSAGPLAGMTALASLAFALVLKWLRSEAMTLKAGSG
ncbi:multidrug effflux MFS transporter [Pseudomonas sp. NPDC087612]|uniref:multidrug effflux MFS transporter n=1 Tax=Pseudomonas sp. NPDC087612 TaxID=3364441 RepID=UPI003823D63D